MKCKRGFVVGTPMRIKCTDTGKWIGSKGECVPQTCPALEPPKNGQIEPKSCSEGSHLFLNEENLYNILNN